jgi:hypothetical protein
MHDDQYCVSEWGNASGLAVQYWTFPLYIITTTASAAIVQSFLIFRFYTLYVYSHAYFGLCSRILALRMRSFPVCFAFWP